MNVDSNFSLYDLVSMFFPGCFILWLLITWSPLGEWAATLPYMSSIANSGIAFFVSAYLVGVVWNMLVGWAWRYIVRMREKTWIKSADSNDKFLSAIPGTSNGERFRYAWWYVRQHDHHYTINVVESQVSLLRNMTIPFSLWVGTIVFQHSQNVCCFILVSVLLIAVLFCAALRRQFRLINLVLNNYNHLKEVEPQDGQK